jgi:lipoyl(octanoyl) transferase
VTSIERQLGRPVSLDEVREVLAVKFSEVFEREAVRREPTIRLVKVVVHDDDRVLLLHRRAERGNFWQPITGSIETGESPLATARRELKEETGYDGEPIDLELSQSFMIESQFLATRYPAPIIASEVLFRATLDSDLAIRIDPEEHDDWGWFTFAEAYEKIRWSDDREAIERVEQQLGVAPEARTTRNTELATNS